MYRTRSLTIALCVASLAAVFPAGCGDDGGGSGGPGGGRGDGGLVGVEGEPAALTGITHRHNQVRASASPAPAEPLPPLTWSDTVAAAARDHAARCVFEHSGNGYGENIYASAGSTPTGATAVDSWASEAADYDYEGNSCDGTCGHYTQVVWADSTKLGCAFDVCDSGSPFGSDFPTWNFIVCDYDPPGNFIGERPY
jgi:pathogenesis-related protein 1